MTLHTTTPPVIPNQDPHSAYLFSFQNSKQEPLPLSAYKGKVLLIVNTASRCGFTKQYDGLEKLYKKYHAQGLEVIAVPSNDFANQEPGTDEEIHDFCRLHYGVSFTVTHKEVVVGKNAHPFYQWAYNELGFGSAPKWNFHKYLINRDGKIVNYFYSTTTPENDRLVNNIEKLLKD